MKILLINQDWFAEEFRALGHEVYCVGMREHLDLQLTYPLKPLDEILQELPQGFTPEALVVLDESAPVFFAGLEETDIPALFYSVDCHHHIDYHKYLPFVFDHVLAAMKDYLPAFEAVGGSVEWMPLWASRHMEASLDKQYGAVFVGNMDKQLNPERVHFFEELGKRVPMLCTMGEYWKIFPYSEIVVNQTVKGDLNFRVFEAMMSGAMLLTERSPNGLEELFKVGEHLVVYNKNDVQEAAELINHYLANQELCRKIGLAGREEILKRHCPEHRAEAIVNILKTLEKKPSPRRYLAQVPNHLWLCKGLEPRDHAHAVRAIQYVLKLIKKGIEHDEALSEELAWHAVRACFTFDRLTRTNLGEKALDELEEAYPNENLSRIAKIWIRMNRGDIAEAKEMVRSIAEDEPESMFQKINEIFTHMLYDK